MSISLEPGKGLRLKFSRFSPIRSWHGGGNFWNHEFQLTVRSGALSGFLPRALEDEDSVLFEYRGGGGELASTSHAIGSLSEIPAKQLKALREAVEELKKKADDPHCDRTKQQMIESFRLPDPERDRDLYRLIGKGGSAKLIVLWGLEREEGSALAPGAAVDLMHTPRGSDEVGETASTVPQKKSHVALVLALILLGALGAGGFFFWQQTQEKQRFAEEAAAASEADRIAAFNANAAALSTGDKAEPEEISEGMEEPLPEGALVTDEEGEVTGVAGKDGELIPAEKGIQVDEEGKVAKKTEPGEIVKDTDGQVKGVVDKDGKIVAAKKGETVEAKEGEKVKASPGTLVRDSKGEIKGVVDKDGKVAAAKPGTEADKDGKVTAAKPGSVFKDEKGSVTGIAGPKGKVISTKPNSVTKRTTTGSTTKSSLASNSANKGKSSASKSKEDGKSKSTAKAKPGSPSKSSGGKSGTPGSSPTASGTSKNTGSFVRNASGVATGVRGADGKVTPFASGTTVSKDGIVKESIPGSVVRDEKGRVTGIVGPDGKVVSAKPGQIVEAEKGTQVTAAPGTVVRDRRGVFNGVVNRSGTVVPARPGTVLDKDGKVVTGAPGTVFRNSTGRVNGVAGSDGKVVDVAPDAFENKGAATIPNPPVASTSPSDSLSTPMTTQGPPPAGISSLSVVSTSLSGVLADGKVEVLLNVVARDLNGSVVNAPTIDGWQVNGQTMNSENGSPASGPVLPVSLSPGVHEISTVGTGDDGKPFQTKAEVTVTPKP